MILRNSASANRKRGKKYQIKGPQRCRLHMLTLEESRNTKCSFKNLEPVSGFIRTMGLYPFRHKNCGFTALHMRQQFEIKMNSDSNGGIREVSSVNC